MLKREPDKNKAESTIWSEIRQLDRLQMNLTKQLGSPMAIQNLAAKAAKLTSENNIETSVVFLTKKKSTPALQKVLKWLGIDKELDDGMIFGGKTTGTLGLGDQLLFTMQLFHFDHYPVRILPECTKSLNIVVYDLDIRKNYPNWDLALRVLGMDPSVCILIDLSDNGQKTVPTQVPRINSVLTKFINITQLNDTINEVLISQDVVQGVKVAKLLNHLRISHHLHDFIEEHLEEREKQWQGKAMITYKKELQIQNNIADRSGKELSLLKLKIDSGYKQLIRLVENKTENLDKMAPGYRQLEDEITSFLGFVENKGSRYLTLIISEGAVQDKIQKANKLLMDYFEDILSKVNKGIQDLEMEIREQFQEWQLDLPEIETLPIDSKLTNEVLSGSNSLPDKPYQKQIISKGIGSLLLELRTPLFMLMPFMMIFALFASLVGEADKGKVDETVMFHENRPAIAINRLPESRNNEFGRFINELERYNAPGKDVFEKGIEGELVTEPQLAVKSVEVPQNYGNGTKTEQRLDYFFDSQDQMVYLYLNPNADRNFVIDKLYDPGLELLTIPNSTRRGFGIGGLIRFLSGLRDYRYIIFIGLLGLISWFIITRKRSMDAELVAAKEKERFKLNSDLKQHMDKIIKLNVQKWRSKLVEELGSRENTLLKEAERALKHNIENKHMQKTQEKKILQKRTASLKIQKSKLSNFKSELHKLRIKFDQLETKFKRTLRTR
ncbi:MAG: hypothetical protein WBM98_16805 [Maribacter sp.]|uniref:hypothetical protein n=1 Tax=Maribacter sp. TaxID=1897614 RepID=UPI003C766386